MVQHGALAHSWRTASPPKITPAQVWYIYASWTAIPFAHRALPDMLSLLLVTALGTLPVAFASEGFPVSASEREGILCGIKTFGRQSNWPDSQLDIVQDTLELEVGDYRPQVATP
jgi:hypothetical protein